MQANRLQPDMWAALMEVTTGRKFIRENEFKLCCFFFFTILNSENNVSVCKELLMEGEREAVCRTPKTSNTDGILMTKVVQTS